MFRHALAPPGQATAREQRPDEQWYINDHCFFVAPDGMIHWYGITNPYPTDRHYYAPGSHRHIGHASTTDPLGEWQDHDDAFTVPEGSDDCVGACFVTTGGDGKYYMLHAYNTGFHVAVSDDLFTWKNIDQPKLDLGDGTRDPCILKMPDGEYLLYATAGHGETTSIIALATSTNCIDWQEQEPALTAEFPRGAGVLESPFVHRRGEWFYLFTNNSHHQYEETLVFASKDPLRFDFDQPLCTMFAHAAEILEFKGKTYMSHCGIEDRHWGHVGQPYGLYLAELDWIEQ